MPERNQTALDFLKTRRSRPAKTLTAPIPDQSELQELLTIAARCPDHGKLEPWRFVVLGPKTRGQLATLAQMRAEALGLDADRAAKASGQFEMSPLCVAVIASPKASEKVPNIEQIYSAGAVCLGLVNAALAAGWGANWLSGFTAYDRAFLTEGLHLAPHEEVAGYIHIGTQKATPPERPRPDMDQITDWRP